MQSAAEGWTSAVAVEQEAERPLKCTLFSERTKTVLLCNFVMKRATVIKRKAAGGLKLSA